MPCNGTLPMKKSIGLDYGTSNGETKMVSLYPLKRRSFADTKNGLQSRELAINLFYLTGALK